MSLRNDTLKEFIKQTHAKESIPGGGGVSALMSALGAALGGMVSNFTLGKKKYAEYEEDIAEYIKRTEILMNELMFLIDDDAENFEPLMDAYKLPFETDEEKTYRKEQIQKNLKNAAMAPVAIVKVSYQAMCIHKELLDKGSSMLISDVAVGVQALKAGLIGGYINAMVNLNSIEDTEYVDKILSSISEEIENGPSLADEIYAKACEKMNIKEIN